VVVLLAMTGWRVVRVLLPLPASCFLQEHAHLCWPDPQVRPSLKEVGALMRQSICSAFASRMLHQPSSLAATLFLAGPGPCEELEARRGVPPTVRALWVAKEVALHISPGKSMACSATCRNNPETLQLLLSDPTPSCWLLMLKTPTKPCDGL
jgi:hypothetical protein